MVNRILKISFLAALFFALSFTNALACTCAEDVEKKISDAIFVGIVKNIDVKELDDEAGIHTISLQILQTYKGLNQNYIDVDVIEKTSCDQIPKKKGDIYEVILSEKNGRKVFDYKCSYPTGDRMDELAKNGLDPKQELLDAQKSCKHSNGIWMRYGSYQWGCFHEAQDAGKICSDSAECEGKCIADLTDEQKDALSRTGFFFEAEKFEPIETKGKCSALRDLVYPCKPLVKMGKVSDYTCFGQE